MNTPLVSIIIPTYNRAHLIGETLDSVLEQTYTNWECIIVDDGSTDNTIDVIGEYLKRDSRFKFYHRPINKLKGANSCRNYGFELSKGELIQWFDSDDIMFEQFIETKVEKFDNNIELVINIGCKNKYEKTFVFNSELIKSDNLFKDYLMWNIKIITPSPMFTRVFLQNKKLFNINIRRGQETEFFSRLFFGLSSNVYRIIDIPEVYYRQHENSISSDYKIYNSLYKDSQLFIFIENINKSIIIKDKDLIKHLYNQLINLFFDVLRNKDKIMFYKVRKEIFQTIKKIKVFNAFLFYILSGFLIITNLKSSAIKKQMKKLI